MLPRGVKEKLLKIAETIKRRHKEEAAAARSANNSRHGSPSEAVAAAVVPGVVLPQSVAAPARQMVAQAVAPTAELARCATSAATAAAHKAQDQMLGLQ